MALVDCTVIVNPNGTIVSTNATVEVQVLGAAGLRGPKGPPGDAVTTQNHVAGVNLSGHRAIRVSSGLAYICDGANAAHAGRCIGITTGAVAQNAVAAIQTVGTLTESSWTWTDGPVFVGSGGVLTQSLVGLAFVQQIGNAISPTKIDINPQLSILIS